MINDQSRATEPAPDRAASRIASSLRPALGLFLLVATLQLGCSTSSPAPDITESGLLRADSYRGELFLRPDHNIGGYDETYLPPVGFSQRMGRKGLHEREVATLVEHLSDNLQARAKAGGVASVSAPAPCAITMAFSIEEVEIDGLMSQIESRSNATFIQSMGAVTLKVVMRDSMTDTPLLQYTERRRLPGGQVRGSARGALVGALEKALNTLLASFAERLRPIIPQSKGQHSIAPQCEGRIRKAAEAAARRR